MNARVTAIGSVTIGMSALGTCHRKKRIIEAETISSSSISVGFNVSIARSISPERS